MSHVDFPGNLAASCMYQTSASAFGRSYALYAEEVVCIFGVCCFSNSSVGFIENCHSLGSLFSLQSVSIGLPPGEKTVKSFLGNATVQFALQIGPTPTIVLVKKRMMYPIVGKSDANCWIGSVVVADNLSTCTFAFTTLICEALVLGGPCGADWAMCR